MTTCNHPYHSHCEFCDPKGRMNVAVDGNGDPQALRPEADNTSRRGMLRGAVATGVGAVGALASAGWVGNSLARGAGGKLGLRNHCYVPATDKTVQRAEMLTASTFLPQRASYPGIALPERSASNCPDK